VIRTGKQYFSTGIVMNKDFSSSVKRVLFHFPKTQTKYDEWIEIGSSRIAPLNTKQDPKNKEKRSKKSGKAHAWTIGGATKDKVPETLSTGKKEEDNKPYPTHEAASGKPPSLKVFKETAAKNSLEVLMEKAASKNISRAKSANVAPNRSGAVTKVSASIFPTASASASIQIAQDTVAFSPYTLVSQQMSTTNPENGYRHNQQIVSVPRRVSDGRMVAVREECSSSVSKSVGADAAVRMPKEEKSIPAATLMTSVATPHIVGVQGTNTTLIGRIPRKTSPSSPSPRRSEASRVGVPNGIHHALQFSADVKTSGSPEQAMAPRNAGRPQFIPSNRPTPIAYDAAKSGVRNGMHYPLQFSVGMYPDSTAAVPRHDGRVGPTQLFPTHQEDQMSQPANWQGYGFAPKYGGQPNKNQYNNRG
jgi:hypothetical protein